MRASIADVESSLTSAITASIFSSAIGLSVAVSICCLVTWYRTQDLTEAQTMAFAAWLLGHVLLALNLRSEREPLLRPGVFSNRVMVIWAVAAVGLLLFATLVPGVRGLFKVAPMNAAEWALALISALIGTFWVEARKPLTFDWGAVRIGSAGHDAVRSASCEQTR